ncbi:GNAT family N-acetyltransferase [Aestuariimicrobium soli]|uniref:GNAT family N-acetyltransferase n=1 Tax=Aestuariimicrobium soli TaxID=2035834 RepID=UPI003EB8BC2E
MEATIRAIERRDAIPLAALRLQQDREAGQTTRPGFLDEYAEALLAEFDSWRGFIAELDDGRPVGCVLAQRVRKLPWLHGPGRAEWWYVQQVFVCPDQRRLGIGRRLVSQVQLAAAEAGVRWLDLRTSAAGRALFVACGFEALPERALEWRP